MHLADDRGPILLVDDNPEIIETTRRYLKKRGVDVITSDSALGVSTIVRRQRPAIIVLDVMMPALDGDALARLLRGQPPVGRVPIIFYSAVDEERLYEIASGIPGASYVPKSDGLAALYDAIMARLAGSGGEPQVGDRGSGA